MQLRIDAVPQCWSDHCDAGMPASEKTFQEWSELRSSNGALGILVDATYDDAGVEDSEDATEEKER